MDTPNQNSTCRCNGVSADMPSFSAPFLNFTCPIDFQKANPFNPMDSGSYQSNDLLLRDPKMRQMAFVNTLDCALLEANTRQVIPKGPGYARAGGFYYRTDWMAPGPESQKQEYCRTW